MNLDFEASDNQFREEVRDWLNGNVPEEPRPHEGQACFDFDQAWQRRQYEGGWAGISWPREYGGRGLNLTRQLIWFEEYARAGAPELGCFSVSLNHAGPTLIARGTDEQKARYLPQILNGDTCWCQGFSEPGSGSDLASIRTRAEIDGDYLVINGSKIWTSHAQYATYQELLVRTDPNEKRHKGITWVIGDMRLEGITIRPIVSMEGYARFCEVFYDNVRIPLENVVGEVNGGWATAMATLGFERGTGALVDQIDLSRVTERLIEMAKTTPGPDGVRPAIKDEEIAFALATLRAEVAALRSMSYLSISRAQRQMVPGPDGAIIAVYNTEMRKRAFELGMRILGPACLEREGETGSWVGRYLNAFSKTISGGTSEIRRNIIAERLLGLPKG